MSLFSPPCSVLMLQSRPPHSAVPVGGARSYGLPGGGSRLGLGPSGGSLLHSGSHHHRGEESLAAEGLSSWKHHWSLLIAPAGSGLKLLSCHLIKITHPEEVIVPESADDMPSLTSVLLSVMMKSPSVTRWNYRTVLNKSLVLSQKPFWCFPKDAFAEANIRRFYVFVFQGIFEWGQLIFGLGSQQQSDRGGRCPSRTGRHQTRWVFPKRNAYIFLVVIFWGFSIRRCFLHLL